MEDELQQVQEIYRLVTGFLVNYSFQIIGALIILVLGVMVARRAGRFVESLMVRHQLDVTLSSFTGAAVKVAIIAMVTIIALGKVGISVTPFIAAIGAAGLGAGLALQGTLSNYGAGICLIVTRPFVVGDTITVQGVTGIVRMVNLGATILSNEDEVLITIPNKYIVGEIIHNSSTDSIVETSVDIAYDADPLRASELIRSALAGLRGISASRVPQVGIDAFAERGIRLGIRFWTRTEMLFQTRYQAHAEIFRVLETNRIELASPLREIRILEQQQ